MLFQWLSSMFLTTAIIHAAITHILSDFVLMPTCFSILIQGAVDPSSHPKAVFESNEQTFTVEYLP